MKEIPSLSLRYSVLSPYARKARIVAHEIGLGEHMELVLTDARKEPDQLAPLNPLGKIPILTVGGGLVLYDSPVICEYLDAEFGGSRLLPASGPKRWEVMTRVALADGVVDTAMIVRLELSRPEPQRSADNQAWYLRKVRQGLSLLDEQSRSFGDAFDMGHIAAVMVVGYLPVRLSEVLDINDWPDLVGWYRRMSSRPSVAKTMPTV